MKDESVGDVSGSMFRKLRWLHKWFLPAALLAIVGFSIFLWISASYFLTPNRRPLEPRHLETLAHPAEHGLEIEPFDITTADGATLSGLIATLSPRPGKAEKTRRMAARLGTDLNTLAASSRGTLFLLHGRSGRKEDMLAIAERFVAAGYRCVTYDARCHGASGGSACTFGHHEREDFAAVIDRTCSLLAERGSSPGPIHAMGISLGAAVLLQSLPSESRLDSVIAVAPFATLPEVINHAAKRNIHRHIPLWLIAGTMRTGGVRAGFDPFTISPLEGVIASSKPVFFVHGNLDKVIPVEHTRRLHAAATGPKQLHLVPEGNHGNVLAKGGDALYEAMIRFCLEGEKKSE